MDSVSDLLSDSAFLAGTIGGNSSSRRTTTVGENNCYVALCEGRGPNKGCIGLAQMELHSGELILCEFMDSASYTMLKAKLPILAPTDVLIPEFLKDTNNYMNICIDVAKHTCRFSKFSKVARRYFNDSKGRDMIKQIDVHDCQQLEQSVIKKMCCLASAHALVKYIEYTHNIFFPQKSIRVIFQHIDSCCLIDVNSWKNLELFGGGVSVVPPKHPGDAKTLFDVLNHCVTNSGRKMLRSSLLQPPFDTSIIEERLDVVQELTQNKAMNDRIRSLLTNVVDLQRLLSLLLATTRDTLPSLNDKELSFRECRAKIQQTLGLRKMLLVVPTLAEIFKGANVSWIVSNAKKLCDPRLREATEMIDQRIDSTILTRKSYGTTKIRDLTLFAVRQGFNVFVDISRQVYTELVEGVQKLYAAEVENMPTLVLSYSFGRGYYLSLPTATPFNVHLPQHYVLVVRHRASVTFTTHEIIKYNDRLIQAEAEVLRHSNVVINFLISDLRKVLPAFYGALEVITQLDFLSSLACYSSLHNCVRPHIADEIIIQNGRHPILDACTNKSIPNDVHLGRTSKLVIITGPNMTGKTTYLKQVCLLQIMAQLGCFVPATTALIAPMKHIFSRMGQQDNVSLNLSSLGVEMTEMSVILQIASEHSLIAIDELGKSTSTDEGIALCYAINEALLKSKANVIFATHFIDLGLMEIDYPNCRNLHFANETVEDEEGKSIFQTTHRLSSGMYKGPMYGLELAEKSEFPPELISAARKLAEKLHADAHTRRFEFMDIDEFRKRKLIWLRRNLLDFESRASNLTDIQAAAKLSELRTRFQSATI